MYYANSVFENFRFWPFHVKQTVFCVIRNINFFINKFTDSVNNTKNSKAENGMFVLENVKLYAWDVSLRNE